MRLAPDEARRRLAAHDHGVLATVHAERGVDAVPVSYALDGEHVAVPVDVVKPKSSLRLQRVRNLEADGRATLLAEHWDGGDWGRLWWVRASLRWLPDPDADLAGRLGAALVARYAQYRGRERPFAEVLVFGVVDLTGWAATPPAGGG